MKATVKIKDVEKELEFQELEELQRKVNKKVSRELKELPVCDNCQRYQHGETCSFDSVQRWPHNTCPYHTKRIIVKF